jgi:thioredoxin-disulfide reductase
MEKIYDVIIIGSGPAGMSAAVYAGRAGLDTLLIEYDAPGGKMVKTQEIQNWPGQVDVAGPKLAYEMYKHALAYGAKFIGAKIVKLSTDEQNIHTLTTDNGTKYQTRTVLLGTGTQEKTFDLPNLSKFEGRGISYCAICDGSFYKNQEIAVFGGGNAALEEAIYLTQFATKVYLVHRRQGFRASQHVIEQVQAHPKIELMLDYTLAEILEEEAKFAGVIIKHKDDTEVQLNIAGMFIYIGAQPRNELLKDIAKLDEVGYIIVNEKMETGLSGIYAIGDICAKTLRQVVTATGDGAIAAQEAFHYIEKQFK